MEITNEQKIALRSIFNDKNAINNSVKKWEIICQTLKITRSDIVEFCCIYAESYSIYNLESNLIPLNLSLISNLDLNDKEIRSIYDNFTLREDKLKRILNIEDDIQTNYEIKSTEIKIKCSKEQTEDLLQLGQDKIFQHFESLLLKELINKINLELKDGSILLVENLAESITIEVDERIINIILKSKYKII